MFGHVAWKTNLEREKCILHMTISLSTWNLQYSKRSLRNKQEFCVTTFYLCDIFMFSWQGLVLNLLRTNSEQI
jgi:hypothetical protein